MAFPLFGKKPSSPSPTAKAPAHPAGANDFGHTEDPNSVFGRPRIEVQETSAEVPAAVEQAAMLYSIDQAEAAIGVLEGAIRGDDLGRYVQRAWGMLFELYQLAGRRTDFDHLAVEFAAKFLTSPPTWVAGEPVAAPSAVASTKTVAAKTSVNLAGPLTIKSQEALKQVFKLAEKNSSVRIDLTKTTEADDSGCALLRSALKQLKKLGKECVLLGADKLAALVAKSTAMGERSHEPAWLLLLDLYQYLGNQDAFDEAAVGYAVTFEVSPPSFEAPKQHPPVKPEAEEEAESETENVGCALEGDITSTTDGAFGAIRAYAETTSDLVVDVSRLRRMDFVSATNLMNLVASLMVAQKKVRLVKASHLVTALWEVIGLDSIAHIETRKT